MFNSKFKILNAKLDFIAEIVESLDNLYDKLFYKNQALDEYLVKYKDINTANDDVKDQYNDLLGEKQSIVNKINIRNEILRKITI